MTSKPAESIDLVKNEHNERLKENLTSKMQQRDQSRLLEAKMKKNLREEEKVTEEKSSFFVKHFQDEIQNLENMLKCENLSKENRTIIMEHFDAITASYQRLQKFFNDSVMFLPKYDSKQAKTQLLDLSAKIDEKRTEMLPKKRFAFKSKSKATGATAAIKPPDNIEQLKESAAKKYASAVIELKENNQSIQNRKDETIILHNADVFKKDISLSVLRDCKVFIYGNPGTVHITDVINSTFVIGPVSGSVFVERSSHSVIATGCQQLRVHHADKTDFYLHVTSRAIIEDTRSIRFAPYSIQYPLLDEHYKLSGLDRDVNHWNDVDDFNWLSKDTPSPNWKVLEEDERKTDW